MIAYEITKFSPQQLTMQVKYSKEGKPDFWKNIRVKDFTEENLHQVALSHIGEVTAFYSDIEGLEDTVEISSTTGVAKEIYYSESPEFDPETQVIETSWEETDDARTEVKTVREKTELELQAGLVNARRRTSISLRQARLYLTINNMLEAVETVIASLPAEQKTWAETEWQFATSVDRLSPTVELIQATFDWTEEQVDEMFATAAQL